MPRKSKKISNTEDIPSIEDIIKKIDEMLSDASKHIDVKGSKSYIDMLLDIRNLLQQCVVK